MPHTSPPRAWAEVDLNCLKHNLNVLRQASPDTLMMPVVKAGAYGHGLEVVARFLDSEGISFFGVANVGEARRLSQCGCRTKPYILGSCFPDEREEIVMNGWCGFVSTLEEAEHYHSLARLYGRTVSVHISIDVGMGRGGFLPDQLSALLDRIDSLPSLRFEGIAAHLPAADEDRDSTLRQIRVFEDAHQLVSRRLPLAYTHIAASAGLLDYDIPFANLARPGLALYGYSPVDSSLSSDLKPAMTMKSRVTVVRTLPPGHGVSYGSIFKTKQPTRVATVGFGYADGYHRVLSGRNARLYYRGQYVPVLGRITMDQLMIDVSSLDDARPGDEVELFGEHVGVPELARLADTIPWEILTSIGSRIPRIYN